MIPSEAQMFDSNFKFFYKCNVTGLKGGGFAKILRRLLLTLR